MKKETTKERTCKERVQEHWDSRKADFQKFIAEENYDDLSDYILDVSHVDAHPVEYLTGVTQSLADKHLQYAPYDRIQISYGGPSEEIRYYESGLVEFVLLDWFDEAPVLLNHQQLECTHDGTAHLEDAQIAEFLREHFRCGTDAECEHKFCW
jgi:hypothetical protein